MFGHLTSIYTVLSIVSNIPYGHSIFLTQAKIKKDRHEISTFMVSMDDLKDVDFYPLLDLLKEIDASEIDAVDIVNKSSCVLNGEYVSALLHAVNKKLRVVDICDISFGKDFLM